ETASTHYFNSGRRHIDDKSRNLIAAVASCCPCHHDNYPALHPVRTPELFSVDDKVRSVRRCFGMCFHLRRIAANLRVSQRKGRHFSASHPREKPAFLLVGPKENERLRNAD